MIKVYKCDHCSATNPIKHEMEEHILKCHLNPNNKSCMLCDHEKFEDSEIERSYCLMTGKQTNRFEFNHCKGIHWKSI